MSIADDLLLLPDDAIDYKALEANVLLELATQDSEPYLATSALGELSGRGAPEARTAALAILANEPWDRYLSAFAVGVLCRIDCGQATEVMRRLLAQTNDPKILGAMIECVLSEPDHFSSEAGCPFAHDLATKVAALNPDQFADADERAAFLARCGRS
jgi:hypothetical protein